MDITSLAQGWREYDTKTLYVYAPSGLNMREGPTVSHEKLTKIPYGAKVELLVKSTKQDLTVDGLPGGMAKVMYNGYTGYTFDGYLSQFQPPKEGTTFKDYLELLRNDGHLVYYEEVSRDYDGYFQAEESLMIHQSYWYEAFLVARLLCKLPPSFNFPQPKDKEETSYKNPDKAEYSWSDELVVGQENGKIAWIEYRYRAEATGKVVRIAYGETDSNMIKITELLIAD
ncbi:MAG: SH3 domain-containing protein [Bacteroidota bacterium]